MKILGNGIDVKKKVIIEADTAVENAIEIKQGGVIKARIDKTGKFHGTLDYANIQGTPSTFTPEAHNHDDRYYTEAEADSRFIDASGDTMNGNLYVNGSIIKQGAGDFIISDQNGVAERQAQMYNQDGTLYVRSDMDANADKLGTIKVQSDTTFEKKVTIGSVEMSFDSNTNSFDISFI